MMIRHLLFLFTCFGYTMLYAQERLSQYHLTGVGDDSLYTLSLNHEIGTDFTSVSVKGHELKIFGVLDVVGIHVFVDTFLELRFRVRSGTGGKVRRSVLLCVSKGKIYKAMDFNSESIWRVAQVFDTMADSLKLFDEKSDYRASLSIQKIENSYEAILSETDKVESKHNPAQNVSFEKSFKLEFDLNGRYFYNETKRLNKRYKIYLSKEGRVIEKFITEEVPCVQLQENVYLITEYGWCSENDDDTLTCNQE